MADQKSYTQPFSETHSATVVLYHCLHLCIYSLFSLGIVMMIYIPSLAFIFGDMIIITTFKLHYDCHISTRYLECSVCAPPPLKHLVHTIIGHLEH